MVIGSDKSVPPASTAALMHGSQGRREKRCVWGIFGGINIRREGVRSGLESDVALEDDSPGIRNSKDMPCDSLSLSLFPSQYLNTLLSLMSLFSIPSPTISFPRIASLLR